MVDVPKQSEGNTNEESIASFENYELPLNTNEILSKKWKFLRLQNKNKKFKLRTVITILHAN